MNLKLLSLVCGREALIKLVAKVSSCFIKAVLKPAYMKRRTRNDYILSIGADKYCLTKLAYAEPFTCWTRKIIWSKNDSKSSSCFLLTFLERGFESCLDLSVSQRFFSRYRFGRTIENGRSRSRKPSTARRTHARARVYKTRNAREMRGIGYSHSHYSGTTNLVIYAVRTESAKKRKCKWGKGLQNRGWRWVSHQFPWRIFE